MICDDEFGRPSKKEKEATRTGGKEINLREIERELGGRDYFHRASAPREKNSS